ncbi:prohibitin family protein [Pyrococcus kukulkanii]|uniref:Prohibitin family protein n=1 Tax=Pyrococcus kukulkanii TaxID=1609559 RepID=A0ABV4T7Q7_9EURY
MKGGNVVALLVVLVVLGAAVLVPSVKIIDATEVGVEVVLGKVKPEPLYPGVHVIPLFIAKVVKYPATVQEIHLTSKEARPFTSEGLEVGVDLSVFYRIDRARVVDIYKQLKLDYEKRLESIVLADLRVIVPKYSSEDLYKQETREKIQAELRAMLEKDFKKYGFYVERVNIRNIELPPEIVQAIEAKIQAKQEAERYKYLVEKEKLESERKIVEAKGIAEANQIIADSLKKNPEYLMWYYMQVLEKFAESQNNAIILVPVPSAYYPNVNITQPVQAPIIMPQEVSTGGK